MNASRRCCPRVLVRQQMSDPLGIAGSAEHALRNLDKRCRTSRFLFELRISQSVDDGRSVLINGRFRSCFRFRRSRCRRCCRRRRINRLNWQWCVSFHRSRCRRCWRRRRINQLTWQWCVSFRRRCCRQCWRRRRINRRTWQWYVSFRRQRQRQRQRQLQRQRQRQRQLQRQRQRQ